MTVETVEKEERGIEGRLRLAEELGLAGPAQFLSEVLEGTSLGFPLITYEGIQKLILSNMKKHPVSRRRLIRWVAVDAFLTGWTIAPMAGATVFSILTPVSIREGDGYAPYFLAIAGVFALLVVLIGAFLFWRGWKRPSSVLCSSIPLERWMDDLPYGALCAVKEAKEAGFKEFQIFYPERAKKADPVIVGTKRKEMGRSRFHLIFHWDEGKDYTT